MFPNFRDDVEWDEELEEEAKRAVEKNTASQMDDEKRMVLDRDADSFWDKFYGIHQNKWVYSQEDSCNLSFGKLL